MIKGKVRVRGVYGKPIVRDTPLEDQEDRTEMLEALGEDAIDKIKKEIRRTSFKGQPTDLLNSFDYEVKGKSTLVIKSDHPAAKYLNKGVRRYQMTHLTKADTAIPIVTDSGEVKFRNATPKSMRDGKWYHPGIKGKHFLDRGVEKAREEMKERVASKSIEEVKKRVRSILES